MIDVDTVPGVISADNVCGAVETTLRDKLGATLEQLGLTERLGAIATWQQLPVREAIASAAFPAVAITSPGLSGNPIRDGYGETRATWRVGVAVYDRGSDHADTQARVRDWCAAIRVTLLAYRSLGGLADAVTWVSEEYALYPQKEVARTFGGGAVGVDVTVEDVATPPPAVPTRPVTSTSSTVTARTVPRET